MEECDEKYDFKKGLSLGIAGTLLLIIISSYALVLSGKISIAVNTHGTKRFAALEKKIDKKVKVLETYIDAYFLDDIDENRMEASVYKGVIAGLGDDYAAYYTEEEFQQITEKTNGVYCGIGAYIAMDEDTGLAKIIQPMKDSPSEKAGVRADDLIYAVDGKVASGMEISEVQALVKGEKGSKVELTLIRAGKKMTLTLTRDEIQEDTVASKMLPGSIGYIQVSSFEQVTPKQFSKAINKLEKQNVKALIIDLRDNGGGLLSAAVSMVDRLLPKGLVVYSKDKDGDKEEYYAENDDKVSVPIAILVNENSASASEVFSGALQDEGAGVLVGTQTFGKGIVQGLFDLGDGSALKMTTAKYYTPKGRNIHGKGLTPDVQAELTENIIMLSDHKTKVDSQAKAAIDYLEKAIQ